MIVLEIATIGEIEFLEFATLGEIRDYKSQPVDRGRLRYQLTTLSVSQSRRVMSSAAASRAGVRDTGRREGAAGNTARQTAALLLLLLRDAAERWRRRDVRRRINFC